MVMKVEYTVPALQPEALPEMQLPAEPRWSFRDQLRHPAGQVPVGYEHELRLDVRPFTATYIGPPPRPPALQLGDVETERWRWHNMVTRHSMPMNGGGANGSAGGDSVQTMIDMLLNMQQMEDSIVSRQAALTRG
jgi:hypothetical protein